MNLLKNKKCPACRKKTLEMKPIDGGFVVVKCTNGECPELPEAIARTIYFSCKMMGIEIKLPDAVR